MNLGSLFGHASTVVEGGFDVTRAALDANKDQEIIKANLADYLHNSHVRMQTDKNDNRAIGAFKNWLIRVAGWTAGGTLGAMAGALVPLPLTGWIGGAVGGYLGGKATTACFCDKDDKLQSNLVMAVAQDRQKQASGKAVSDLEAFYTLLQAAPKNKLKEYEALYKKIAKRKGGDGNIAKVMGSEEGQKSLLAMMRDPKLQHMAAQAAQYADLVNQKLVDPAWILDDSKRDKIEAAVKRYSMEQAVRGKAAMGQLSNGVPSQSLPLAADRASRQSEIS